MNHEQISKARYLVDIAVQLKCIDGSEAANRIVEKAMAILDQETDPAEEIEMLKGSERIVRANLELLAAQVIKFCSGAPGRKGVSQQQIYDLATSLKQ